MARKRLSIAQWNGGMSNDAFSGQAGSSFICENLEIRKNTKFLQLAGGTEDLFNTSGKVNALLGTQTSDLLSFSETGYINNLTYNSSNNGGPLYFAKNTSNSAIFKNIVTHTISGTEYTLILTSQYIHRFIYDSSNAFFGILGNDLVEDPNFNDGTKWTGANWTVSGGTATHVSGSTTALTPNSSITVAATRYYRVRYRIDATSGTTGTFTISLGGITSSAIVPVPGEDTVLWFATSGAGNLTITPSNTCNVVLDKIQVQRADLSGGVGVEENYKTFTKTTSFRPTLSFNNILYIGSGNTVESLSVSGVLSTLLTIDTGYTIRAITSIGDQIIIWAQNGSSGRQYFWDGASTATERMIQWIDLPFQNVVVLGNFHYVWTAKDENSQRNLFVSDGYSRTLVFKSKIPINVTSDPRGEVNRLFFTGTNTNAIETDGDIVYLPGEGKIYQYGKVTPGTPSSLDIRTTFTGTELTAMYTTSGNVGLWFAVNNSGTFTVKRLENRSNYPGQINNKFTGNGIIELNPYIGLKSQEKGNLYINIGYYLPHASTSINVYSRLESDRNSFTFWVSGITVTPTAGAVYTYNTKSFTVVSSSITAGTGYITATRTVDSTNAFLTAGTLAKSSGTGDASISFSRWIQYNIIGTITDITAYKYRPEYISKYNQIQFALELVSTNDVYTPELWDFSFVFDELNNDV